MDRAVPLASLPENTVCPEVATYFRRVIPEVGFAKALNTKTTSSTSAREFIRLCHVIDILDAPKATVKVSVSSVKIKLPPLTKHKCTPAVVLKVS